MLSRILSQVCSQTHITHANAILATKFSKSLQVTRSKTRSLTTVPFYQSNSLNSKNSIQNCLISSPVTPAIQLNTLSNNLIFPNKTLIRTYIVPHYIFKEWVNTKSYRSDKWYRYQRSKRRRHKKWLKKTRVKRLVRKTLLENRVKAMRENRIKKMERQIQKEKERAEERAAWEQKRDELARAKDKLRREQYDEYEKLPKELKEKRLDEILQEELEAELAGNPD